MAARKKKGKERKKHNACALGLQERPRVPKKRAKKLEEQVHSAAVHNICAIGRPTHQHPCVPLSQRKQTLSIQPRFEH